jgi:RND superfamily putative drug exporter
VQQWGVGLAVAVILDATVVRVMLLPAAMALLGRRAWWLPRWLDRALPMIHVEGSAPPRPARRMAMPPLATATNGNGHSDNPVDRPYTSSTTGGNG